MLIQLFGKFAGRHAFSKDKVDPTLPTTADSPAHQREEQARVFHGKAQDETHAGQSLGVKQQLRE